MAPPPTWHLNCKWLLSIPFIDPPLGGFLFQRPSRPATSSVRAAFFCLR